jgi:hypothetical protein
MGDSATVSGQCTAAWGPQSPNTIPQDPRGITLAELPCRSGTALGYGSPVFGQGVLDLVLHPSWLVSSQGLRWRS